MVNATQTIAKCCHSERKAYWKPKPSAWEIKPGAVSKNRICNISGVPRTTQIKPRVTMLRGLIFDLEPNDKSKPSGRAVINVIKKIKKV